MQKTVSAIMARNVIMADMNDSIADVESLMNSHEHHCIPVIDSEGMIFGMISLKDVENLHAGKRNLKALKAWEECTYRPIEIEPDISIEEAARIMAEHDIHHVVVTENKAVKGIVSSMDIVKEYLLQTRS